MSYWSALRRSSSRIHSIPVVKRIHCRQFSSALPPSESAHFQKSSGGDAKGNILRLISAGIITSSTLAFYLYSFSYSPLSFADWSEPASVTPARALSQSALNHENKEYKFLFGGL